MTCAGGRTLGNNTLIITNIKIREEHERHVLEACDTSSTFEMGLKSLQI